MNTKVKSYRPPFTIGEPMEGGGIGEVYRIGSGVTGLKKGDVVRGMVKWEKWTIIEEKQLTKLDKDSGVGISHYLGALGRVYVSSLFFSRSLWGGESLFWCVVGDVGRERALSREH